MSAKNTRINLKQFGYNVKLHIYFASIVKLEKYRCNLFALRRRVCMYFASYIASTQWLQGLPQTEHMSISS